jgi:uncharacterized protein YraI
MIRTSKLLAATAILALTAGAAAAATVETDSNMRTGPGTEYPVLDVIPEDAPIGVLSCPGSWCRVSYNGSAGYVARSLIDFYDDGDDDVPAYRYGSYYDPDYAYAPGYYGYGGPTVGFGLSYGQRGYGRHWRDGRRDGRPHGRDSRRDWNGPRQGNWNRGGHGRPSMADRGGRGPSADRGGGPRNGAPSAMGGGRPGGAGAASGGGSRGGGQMSGGPSGGGSGGQAAGGQGGGGRGGRS